VKVPIELPPVGILTLRGRRSTPSAEQLMACLREAAAQPQPKAQPKPQPKAQAQRKAASRLSRA
jgi:hypothetical protein